MKVQGSIGMERNKILVCDDDKEIREAIKTVLIDRNYRVVEAKDGSEAVELASEDFDLMILDVMMPNKDGLVACKEIRDKGYNMPILFLTAKATEYDKYSGLRAGADDYIAKPFSMLELTARVGAMIRRYQVYKGKVERISGENLVYKDIVINLEENAVFKNGERIILTTTEYKILRMLVENPDEVFTIEEIYKRVWKSKYMVSVNNTVVVHLNNIRKKLGETVDNRYIKNVWGRGYCIESGEA